jgi:hypothetical protein
MPSIWDIAFDLIKPTGFPTPNVQGKQWKIGPHRDFAEWQDPKTQQVLRTQNLKKNSSNTAQVFKDQQKYREANIVWVFSSRGAYAYRIDLRVDNEGLPSGELYQLYPDQHVMGAYPDDPDITLQELHDRTVEQHKK